MKKVLVIVSIAVLSSGCASTLHEFHNRAVVEDNVEDAVSTLSLNAQRRTVIISLENKNRGKFCAEPPPDVAESVATSLETALKAKIKKIDTEVEGSLKDELKTEITVLSQRTAALDVFRTGTYALCQYYLNDAINGKELHQSFDSLVTDVLKTMRHSQNSKVEPDNGSNEPKKSQPLQKR